VIDAIVATHEARFRDLDPLLPPRHPLPKAASGRTPILVDGAVGYPYRIRIDADTPAADWNTLDEHRIVARVGGPDPVASMDALLAGWAEEVHANATAQDQDSAAMFGWPSRDNAMTPLFLDRGLIPLRVLAARPANWPSLQAPTPAVIRPITEEDLDDLVDLHVEQVRWGIPFGGSYVRARTAEMARGHYASRLEHDQPWTWIAEHHGRPVGMVTVTPPEQAGWLTELSSASTPAYLGTTVVRVGHRANGVGTALVAHAHNALERAGVDLILLHYAPLNPLSAPFWHRHGYRPLWNWWAISPALRLRRGNGR